MANIVGTRGGLSAAPIKYEAPPIIKPKELREAQCKACGGIVSLDTRRRITAALNGEGMCNFCVGFFGFDGWKGVTDCDYEDATARILKLQQLQWGIIIKNGRFGDVRGLTIEIGIGDIFKIQSAGAEGRRAEREQCSVRMTMAFIQSWERYDRSSSTGDTAMTDVLHTRQWGDLILRGMGEATDACFTSDRHGTFNVTRAFTWAIANKRRFDAIVDVADTLRGVMKVDLDMQHMMALGEIGDEELMRLTILLYIDCGDGTHLLIDGNHRMAEHCRRAAKAGIETLQLPGLRMTMAEAEQFRVTYHARINGVEREISAQEVLDEISGIYSMADGTIRDRRET